MQTRRIHITGASGAGVTSLGRALAGRMGLPHHDTDDYYWQPTARPYAEKRPVADRLRLMGEMFLTRPGWILSGSLDGWSDRLVDLFDLVVFVSAPTDLRLRRLRAREALEFGADAVAPGGWRAREVAAFLDWASHYEDSSRQGRSRRRHEAWLLTLPCPVCRVDGERPIAALAGQVVAAFDRRR